MKIVIDIADSIKEQIDDGKGEEMGIPLWLSYAIANGTVLPKGHSRLIDVENAKTKLCRVADRVPEPSKSCYIMSALYLDNTDEFPTVIEADREGKDERQGL